MDISTLWDGLGWPLLRLTFFISIGLLVANIIESLHWTRAVARIASPLVRLGHLRDIAGASFSMAFFSGVAANTMLAEAHDKGQMSDRELLFANLFNSLPTYFLHLPTMFFITLPFIGGAAVQYVSITLGAAFLRTAMTVLAGRLFLPPLPEGCVECQLEDAGPFELRAVVRKIIKRFLKRIRKVLKFTVPIFTVIFFLNHYGAFGMMEEFLSEHVTFLSFLPPEALSIVIFHMAGEFTAGLAASGALLESGGLAVREVVLALLVGNVLSSPMRMMRHQFPYYAGIYRPRMAFKLIACNQTLRAGSLIVVGVFYYLVTLP